MKRTVLSLLFFVAASLLVGVSLVLAQNSAAKATPPGYYRVVPLHGATKEEVMRGAAAATSIPLFSYAVTASRDGNSHSGVMVGRSPFFHGARTTNIKAVIIPVVFKLPDAANNSNTDVFDPTVADPTCSPNGKPLGLVQNSPIFQTFDYTMPAGGIDVGTGQYLDEFQRANFFSSVMVTGDRFHTVLSPVTTAPTQTVTITSTNNGQGWTPDQFAPPVPCTALGVVDSGFWDPSLNGVNSPGEAQTIISKLTAANVIGPTTLPIFLFYNVVLATGTSPFVQGDCCILGYHGSQGSPVQTYSIANYETTGLFSPGEDISAMSHEIGEWMDDPLGDNIVPVWGHIGQQGGCQDNLEVGDPLSGTQFTSVTLGGMTYHPQELAFFSWFYGAPSIGAESDFSNNGTFMSDAGALCM